MPSRMSERLLRQFGLLKPLLRSMDIEGNRRGQDALGELGARILRDKVVYAPKNFEAFDAEWAYPLNGPANGVLLYLHGGAYTAGTLSYAKGFGGVLADSTRRNTLCVGYRLAPEYPFPAALEDATAAYLRIRKMYPSQPVALVGESAGGGLCFTLALHLKELGAELPAAIVALSPWTDLTCTAESFARLADVDPSLYRASLVQSAGYYGGDDLENPLVSPLYGDLAGLPDTLIFAGSHELLVDDSIRMAGKLQQAGVPAQLHVEEGMWHAYVLYGTPEAKRAMRHINRFLDERLSALVQV